MPRHSQASSANRSPQSFVKDFLGQLQVLVAYYLSFSCLGDFFTQHTRDRGRTFSGKNETANRIMTEADIEELSTMGDWATSDSYEWDLTDITLSTDEGLRWLQSLGIVSEKYRVENLSVSQKAAVDRLMNKLKEKHRLSSQPELTPQHLEDEFIKPDIQEVMTLFSEEHTDVQKQSRDVGPARSEEVIQETSSPRTTLTTISDAIQRLNIAWSHAIDAKTANKHLESEMTQLLLMSRARIQAEIIGLRRENKAMRQDISHSQATKALVAERAIIAQLQALLDQRDAEIMYMSHELKQKNNELAVLRSARDLSASWRENRQGSPSVSLLSTESRQPMSGDQQTLNTPASSPKQQVDFLNRRTYLDDLLDRHGVPRRGRREELWQNAAETLTTEHSSAERHKRLEFHDGSRFSSEFAI
eukprot:gene597-3911_t